MFLRLRPDSSRRYWSYFSLMKSMTGCQLQSRRREEGRKLACCSLSPFTYTHPHIHTPSHTHTLTHTHPHTHTPSHIPHLPSSVVHRVTKPWRIYHCEPEFHSLLLNVHCCSINTYCLLDALYVHVNMCVCVCVCGEGGGGGEG